VTTRFDSSSSGIVVYLSPVEPHIEGVKNSIQGAAGARKG
jgi:hypothetical protein